ncbi:MAG TPA: hypothetical protein VKP30_04805 [Polyangiaceae bacterium]|nr:hypothetical protein [Polyangiaceae bacterium]
MVSEKRGGASKYWAAAALAASSCILDLNPQPEEPETDGNDDAPAATESRGGATQKHDTGRNNVSVEIGRGGAPSVTASTVVVYSSGGSVVTTISHTTVDKEQDPTGSSSGDSSSGPSGGSLGAGGAPAGVTSNSEATVGTGTDAFGLGGGNSATAKPGTGGRRSTEIGGAYSPGGAASSSLPPAAAGQGAVGGAGGLAGQSGTKSSAGALGLTSAGKRSR